MVIYDIRRGRRSGMAGQGLAFLQAVYNDSSESEPVCVKTTEVTVW